MAQAERLERSSPSLEVWRTIHYATPVRYPPHLLMHRRLLVVSGRVALPPQAIPERKFVSFFRGLYPFPQGLVSLLLDDGTSKDGCFREIGFVPCYPKTQCRRPDQRAKR